MSPTYWLLYHDQTRKNKTRQNMKQHRHESVTLASWLGIDKSKKTGTWRKRNGCVNSKPRPTLILTFHRTTNLLLLYQQQPNKKISKLNTKDWSWWNKIFETKEETRIERNQKIHLIKTQIKTQTQTKLNKSNTT